MLVTMAALFWGCLVEKWANPFFDERRQGSLWQYFWTGLVFIGLLLSACGFLMALNGILKSLIWIGLLLPLFIFREISSQLLKRVSVGLKNMGWAGWSLFGISAGIGLIKSCGIPEIFDEGAYHLPLVRMWETEGVVAGVANLNGHYGLNSVWHLLSALANLDFLPGFKTDMPLNGLLAAILGLFAGSRLDVLLNETNKFRVSSFLAAFLPFFLFRNLLSSPSTDIPAIIATWFIFVLWLEDLENNRELSSNWILFLLLPVWIVTIKSSSAGMLLVAAGFLIAQARKTDKKPLLAGLLVSGLVLLPWLLQNWIMTGYAIFPIKLTAIGNPAWQVPIESINKKFYLEQFGAFAPPSQYSMDWLKTWFSAQNPDSRVIILLAGIFLIRMPFQKFEGLPKKSLIYLYSIVLIQETLWFFTITEPRYGFGALLFSALILPAIFLQKMVLWKSQLRYFCILVIFAQSFNLFKTARDFSAQAGNIFTPAPAPSVSYRKIKCGNFTASSPEAYETEVPAGKPVFCWDCPFPCFPLEGKSDSSHVFVSTAGIFLSFEYHDFK